MNLAASTRDAYYKDGYQVPEGGDYIVRPLNPEKSRRWDTHVLICVADDRVIGTYCGRAAACKRAQSLGGNSVKSRRASSFLREYKGSTSVALRLNSAEKLAVDKALMTRSQAKTSTAIAKERSKELRDLYKAARVGTPGAEAAIEEHHRTDYIEDLKKIVSESSTLEHDDRFNTPAMKRYLRQYSLGPVRIQNAYGPSIPKNAYRRVHVEAAWFALPGRKRLQRARQHYRLGRYLDETGENLLPVAQWKLDAVAAVLKEFPVPTARPEEVHD